MTSELKKKSTKVGAAVLLTAALCVTGSAAAQAAPRGVVITATSSGTYAQYNCYSGQTAIDARPDARIYTSCYKVKSLNGANIWEFKYIMD